MLVHVLEAQCNLMEPNLGLHLTNWTLPSDVFGKGSGGCVFHEDVDHVVDDEVIVKTNQEGTFDPFQNKELVFKVIQSLLPFLFKSIILQATNLVGPPLDNFSAL